MWGVQGGKMPVDADIFPTAQSPCEANEALLTCDLSLQTLVLRTLTTSMKLEWPGSILLEVDGGDLHIHICTACTPPPAAFSMHCASIICS